MYLSNFCQSFLSNRILYWEIDIKESKIRLKYAIVKLDTYQISNSIEKSGLVINFFIHNIF